MSQTTKTHSVDQPGALEAFLYDFTNTYGHTALFEGLSNFFAAEAEDAAVPSAIAAFEAAQKVLAATRYNFPPAKFQAVPGTEDQAVTSDREDWPSRPEFRPHDFQ